MIRSRRRDYSQPVPCWSDDNLLELECKEIGEHYGRYRLHLPEAERAMARSLERYGQLSVDLHLESSDRPRPRFARQCPGGGRSQPE